MKKKIKNNKVRNTAIVIILIGFGLVCFFTVGGNYIDTSLPFSPDVLAKYGDFIGGTVGTLFTLAGIMLIFHSISQQTQILDQQQKMIDQQDQMMRSQEAEAVINRFFEMLTFFREDEKEVRAFLKEIEESFLDVLSTGYIGSPRRYWHIYANIIHVFTTERALKRDDLIKLPIEVDLTRYLRNMDHIIETIGQQKDYEVRKAYEGIFLRLISDAEYKMMSYYYYLVHDLAYSSDTNPEKKYKVLQELSIKINYDFRINTRPWEDEFKSLDIMLLRKKIDLKEVNVTQLGTSKSLKTVNNPKYKYCYSVKK